MGKLVSTGPQEHDADVLTWLAQVARAVSEVGSLKTDYGLFTVNDVSIAFDGEPTSYSLVPSETHNTKYDVITEGELS